MEKLNCPNCGAAIQGTKCQYCGTVFYVFASIRDDAPTYISIKYAGNYLVFRARMMTTELYMERDALPNVTVDFMVLPDDEGVFLKRIEGE